MSPAKRAYYYGRGSFSQSAGSHAPSTLLLGFDAAATGFYSLTGGSLSPNSLAIAYNGTGSFTQSAGSNSIATSLTVGSSTGGNGSYSLSGTGSLNAADQIIGQFSLGTFIHSAGSNSITNQLTLGSFVGSTGTYSLSGTGSLSVPRLRNRRLPREPAPSTTPPEPTPSRAPLRRSANGLHRRLPPFRTAALSANSEFIGYSANSRGTFTQSGGTHSITGSGAHFELGSGPNSSATYNLSGGSLTVAPAAFQEYIAVDGNATFNQSGGTHTVNSTFFSIGFLAPPAPAPTTSPAAPSSSRPPS